jgi:RimJ/RimL family protein N-acetyltransferase
VAQYRGVLGISREDMLAHGVWRDSVVYGVLESEWRAEGD